VTVTNRGPDPSAGAGLVFTAGQAVSCVPPAGTASCSAVPALAPGASATFPFVAAVDECSGPASLPATATITPPAEPRDPSAGNDSATCAVTVPPPPAGFDLQVSFTAPPAVSAAAADGSRTVTFPLRVRNEAACAAASGVRLVVTPAAPAGLQVTPLAVRPPCSGGFPCPLGALAPGAAVDLELAYRVLPACGTAESADELTLAATATAANGASDADTRNNADTALTSFSRRLCTAGLSLVKSAPAAATAGGPLVYTLTVSNGGPDGPVPARVVDDVPDVLDGVEWSCEGTPGVVCPQQPAGAEDVDAEVLLPAGGVATFTVAGTLPAGACGPLANDAEVVPGAQVTDDDRSDNGDGVSTLLTPPFGVCAVKSILYGPLTAGGSVTYEVLLVNGGAPVADGAGDEFRDLLPPSLALSGATASSGTVATAGNLVTWNGALPAGGVVTLTISADLMNGIEGVLVCNQGEVLQPSFVLTDDPQVPGSEDPTCFVVSVIVPAAGRGALALLALFLAAAGWLALRRLG
jgi:uncharacterized repeat protein (TIGR01451 family)